MAVVRIDLEVDAKGAAKIKEVGGQLKDLEGKGKSTGSALTSVFQGIGQGIGQELFGALKNVATGILGASSAAIAYGGHLKDVKAQTGVAVVAQQQLDHAAKLVGLSFESIVPSLGKMQQALVDTPEKFQRLGLSVANLQKMKPEDQFLAIADRIGQIADPAQRSAAAIEIFGKAGTTLLPLLTSNIREAMEEAQRLGLVMSDEVAGAADDLGDSLDTLNAVWDGLIRNFGAAIVTSEPLHRLIKGLTEILGTLSKDTHDSQAGFRALVDGGVLIFAQALGVAIKIVGAAIDVWSALQIAIVAVAGKFNEATVAFGIWRDVLNGTLSPMKANEELQKRQAEAIRKTNQDIQAEITTNTDRQNKIAMVGAAVDKLTQEIRDADGVVHIATETEKKHTLTLREKEEALPKLAKALQQYTLDVQDEFNRIWKIEQQDQEQKDKNEDEFVASLKRQDEAYQRWVDARKKGEQEVADEWARLQREEFMQGLDNLQNLGDAISNLGDAFGSGLVSAVGQAISGFAEFAKQAANVTTWAEAATVALNAMASAYAGGKQSKSPGKGALQGAAKGAAAGSMFGPYGMVIGGAIGGIVGFLGGEKGQKEELAGLRSEFEALMAQARQAGVVFDHVFNPRNAQQYKAAIDEVKRALDTQSEAQEKLHDALSRYNFTLAEQGPILAAQELDQKFAQIYQDYQLLTAAGVDHNAILREMGPNVSQYVDQALSAGVAIPAAMKPIIQSLFESGKLIHENGDAYTQAEVDGLTYTQTMSEMFTSLIEKVDQLVSAILGIPDKTVNVNVNRHYTDSTGDDGGRDGDPATPAAMGFHGLVTGPRLFLAGERGAERVDIGPGGGGDGMTEATGQAMLEAMRRLPRALSRATRDAMMTTA